MPHIGWNRVKFTGGASKVSASVQDNSYFYFDHSYYAEPKDKTIVAGTTDYGISFTSMICKDSICAVQFHPERSQELGLKILKNFLGL